MKLDSQENVVLRSGEMVEGTFSIKNSPKAFEILSKQLYSDVPWAIVRELSANALDAHKTAGTLGRPFEVHLPNNLEPHFAIRDYGTGLSHDSIMSLYTTYFESSKSDTNDYVGCFGLGSKTPFAYSDNFTVISFYNGKVRTYSLFKGEDGSPKVILLDTRDTDVHNGMEISIPIKLNDHRTFLQAAVKTYANYPPNSYIVTGNSSFKTTLKEQTRSVMFEEDGWFFGGKNSGPSILMSYTVYPIDLKSLQLESKVRDLYEFFPVCIKANIGDVEVSASREDLHYNKRTITYIIKKLKEISSVVTEKILFDICRNSKSLYEARLKLSYYYSRYQGLIRKSINNLNKTDLIWNGVRLIPDEKYDEWTNDVPVIVRTKESYQYFYLSSYKRKLDKMVCNTDRFAFEDRSSSHKFFIKDQEKIVTARARNYIEKKYINDLDGNCTFHFITKEQQEELGIPDNLIEPIKTSEFPKLPKVERITGEKKVSVYGRLLSADGRISHSAKEVPLDSKGSGFYIPYSGNYPAINVHSSSGKRLSPYWDNFVNTYKTLKGLSDFSNIYVVPEGIAKKLRGTWIDVIKDCEDLINKTYNIEETYISYELSTLINDYSFYKKRAYIENIRPLVEQGIIQTNSSLKNLYKNEKSSIVIYTFGMFDKLNKAEYKGEIHRTFEDIKQKVDRLRETYPLLSELIDHNCYLDRDNLLENITEYIQWVDKRNDLKKKE